MIRKIILHMRRIQAKPGFGCQQERFISYCKQLMCLGAGDTATGTFCNLYHHLCFETVFSALMKARGLQNSQFSNSSVNQKNLEVQPKLFKNPNFPSLFMNWKKLEVYTAQDQHFKIQILNIWMSWEKLCPNLSFTVDKDAKFT